jgi:hypothetical protein
MSEIMAHTITLHLLDAPGRVHRFMRKHPSSSNGFRSKELASYLNLSAETLSRLEAARQDLTARRQPSGLLDEVNSREFAISLSWLSTVTTPGDRAATRCGLHRSSAFEHDAAQRRPGRVGFDRDVIRASTVVLQRRHARRASSAMLASSALRLGVSANSGRPASGGSARRSWPTETRSVLSTRS